jgi:hypothetical protein
MGVGFFPHFLINPLGMWVSRLRGSAHILDPFLLSLPEIQKPAIGTAKLGYYSRANQGEVTNHPIRGEQ